jgi:hypothetical protein
VFSEDGPFGAVVIDPPWNMEKIDRDVRPDPRRFPLSDDEPPNPLIGVIRFRYTLSRGGSEKSLAFWRILDSF